MSSRARPVALALERVGAQEQLALDALAAAVAEEREVARAPWRARTAPPAASACRTACLGVAQRRRHLAAHRGEQRGGELDRRRAAHRRRPPPRARASVSSRGAVVGDERGELVERIRARRARPGDAASTSSSRPRARGPSSTTTTASAAASSRRTLPSRSALRRQLGGALRQLRRGHGRPAARRLGGGRLERRGDRLVRPLRGGGEMARALLPARRRRGPAGRGRPPFRGRRALLHHRRDQRVGEAQPVAVADEDVGGERRLEPRRRLGLHRVGRRVSERRDDAQQRAGVRRQRREPAREQPPHVGRRARPPARGSAPAPSAGCRRTRVQARERGRGSRSPVRAWTRPAELGGAERGKRQLERVARGQAAHERGERLVRLAAADGGDDVRAAGRRAAAGRTTGPPRWPRPATASRRPRAARRPAGASSSERHASPTRRGSTGPAASSSSSAAASARRCGAGSPASPSITGAQQVVERRERARRLGRGRPRLQHQRSRPRRLAP